MKMNFFKKVMTFFSIIWNAILWRRTVKDKKSKQTEKGAAGKNVPSETKAFTPEEEADKAFVDVPLNTPAIQEANQFRIDSETNLHDPMTIQDVSELTLPIVAQSLNFPGLTQVGTESPLVDKTQADDLVRKIQSDLVGCQLDEQLWSDSFSPPTEGTDLSERDDLHEDKDTNGLIVSEYTDQLGCQNITIVETVFIQPCPTVVLFDELKDDFEKDMVNDVANVPIIQIEGTNAIINAESHELIQSSSRISAGDLQDQPTDVPYSEQDITVPQNLEKTDSYTDLIGDEVSKHDAELSLAASLSQEVMPDLNVLEDDIIDVHETDTTTVFDKVMSSDGDYVLQGDVIVQEGIYEKVNEEIFADENQTLLLAKKEEESKYEHDCITNKLGTLAVVHPGETTNITDHCSAEISHINQEDDSNFGVVTEVQTSVSSVELSENAKCGEVVSDLLSVDYSTNYMVRSDSLVNFLPNARFQEEIEPAPIVLLTAELSEDTVCVQEKVIIIPEPNCIDEASQVVSHPVEQSCLEEIMCTSTGILKLSDSGGDERQSNSLDASIKLEDDSTPENKTSEEKEEETPINPCDFLLPGVFRYDGRGMVSDFGNLGAGVVETGQAPQSDPVNFPTKTQRLEYKGKELGHKVHAKEESNEHSSTKSENDTLENIDELSYDVSVTLNNIIQGENVFQDNENASNTEEFEMDPVVVLRRIRSQGQDESAGTGTNGNIPSLPKSEIYFQGSGGTNSSGHSDGNISSNVNQRLQDHMPMRDFETPLQSPHNVSMNVPNYNFPGQYLPRINPADYDVGASIMPAVPSFGVNNITLDDSIPILSVGITNYYETSKWQQPIPCTAPEDEAAISFDTGGLRFVTKNESLFYTQMKPENKTLDDGSDSYISKVSTEFYPFIDGASYVFGIPEEIRKDEYFNPCVGAAPSGRAIPGKPAENLKCEALKVEGFKLDEHNNFMGKRDQSWSMAQRPLQHDLFATAEGLESTYTDGSYRAGMKVSGESEHLQKTVPQPCRVWNASEQLLPVEKTAPYLNGFETNEHYPHALENVHPHPVDFVPVDYLQNAVYDNNQNTVCNTSNGYEFINPYGVGVFPMLNIPFCLPDPSFVPRGPAPPFVFPIGPVNIEQDEGPPVDLEPDDHNTLYPLAPHPYWVGFQQTDDNGSRGQTDISMKNEMSTVDMDRNYPLPQICVNETIGDEDDVTDECPIPDPYFQLAENSSLHSVKSKAESYNGSLFCESLRSILSSHNAESDNVIPSFSCSSVRCYNPSLVVRSCETSLSNDSLPSIIVEGSYSKSVDEDYPAKEKFMNDVNTALNESMMDQIQDNVDEFPADFLGRGDHEVELMETSAGIVPEDIERTLQDIIETNDTSEFGSFNEEYSGHNVLSGEMLEGHNAELVNLVDDGGETLDHESNVDELLTEILGSVIDNALKNEDYGDNGTSDGFSRDDENGSELVKDEGNELETWMVSEEAEENIVVQHMVHLEERFVNDDEDVIDVEDLVSNGSGVQCGDSNKIVNIKVEEDSIVGEEISEVPFHGINDRLVKVDDRENRLDINDHSEARTWSLEDADQLAAKVDMRGRELVCEDGEELVCSNAGMSSTDQNMRKSRRNRRRKRKGVEVPTESERTITAEVGIGDGSKQQEVIEDRLDKQEGHSLVTPQEVVNFEHGTIPEAMEGPTEEAKATGEDEDQCREDQEGDHDEHDGSLGNSSNNRKRRNRRKKRKN